jgi:nitrite reductase/ring-hydroxylating ferredoxin subunit
MDERYEKVIALADLSPGKPKPLAFGGQNLLVCQIAGGIHVVENRCSHTDAPLDRARIRDGMIVCPVHGAKFDPVSGAPRCPPATAPLVVFPARVTDGWVEVMLIPAGETDHG